MQVLDYSTRLYLTVSLTNLLIKLFFSLSPPPGYYELLVLQEVSQQGPHAEGEHLVCHLIRTSQVFEDELFIKDASLDSRCHL